MVLMFLLFQELNSQLFVADQTDGPCVSVQSVPVGLSSVVFDYLSR